MASPVNRAVLIGVAAAALVGFGSYGVATGAHATVTYVITVVVLGVVVVALDRSVGFSNVVAVGFTLWGVTHLAGGLVQIGGDRVLYNAVPSPAAADDPNPEPTPWHWHTTVDHRPGSLRGPGAATATATHAPARGRLGDAPAPQCRVTSVGTDRGDDTGPL